MPSICADEARHGDNSKDSALSKWFFEEASEDAVRCFLMRALGKHRNQAEEILDSLANEEIMAMKSSNGLSNGQVQNDGKQKVQVLVTDMEKMLMSVDDPYNIDGKLECVFEREAEDFDRARDEDPIVQFSSPMFFCSLDEETRLTLDLIRIGDLSKRSVVSYTTKDASAKAGEKFVHSSGQIIFEPGSNAEELNIDLIHSPVFDTTTEFKVQLTSDPPLENCVLGRYLYMARVKVIDGKCFPSNKYAAQLKAAEFTSIPFWGLFVEYIKFNWTNRIVRKGSIKWLMVNMCASLYLLMQLLLNVFLVDKVLKESSDVALVQLCLIGVALLVPFAGLHYLQYRRVTWKVGGASRALLQNSLLRKFLNYGEDDRGALNCSDLMLAMTRDVTEVVHKGYVKVLDLISSLADLLAAFSFNFIAPFIFGKDVSPLGFFILAAFPAILISFLFVRREITTKYISLENSAQDELVATVDRTIINYRLVADYGQRPFFETRFAKTVAKYNGDRTAANKVLTNNRCFSPWITTIFLVAYTIYGGMRVTRAGVAEDEKLTIGMFLANMKIIKQIGSSWGAIYKVLMDVEAIYPALMHIVELINMPTDVPARKELNRHKRASTAVLRKKIATTVDRGWPADNLPIVLEDLKYHYGADSTEEAFEMRGVLRFHQGEFTSLVGPPGEGKSTLLRMMGGVILPKPGSLFVPSHLRILHVASEPLFIRASLFDNLTFGCIPGDPDVKTERVVRICQRLGIKEEYLDFVKEGSSGHTENWTKNISMTHKCLLAHARAFITNPELMCIHKPLMVYNDAQSESVLCLLKEFCLCKGVEQDNATRHLRRPRTCLITASKMSSVGHSDHVYHVSHKAGIRYVPKEMCSSLFASGQALQKHEHDLHMDITSGSAKMLQSF